MKVDDYLAALKATAARPSVYAVAQLLELPEEHVRHWYRGRSKPDTLACVKIAQALGLDPLQVIADVAAERERDEGKKAQWREIARKWNARAASLIIACAIFPLPNDAHSATARRTNCCETTGSSYLFTNYATVRRMLRRLFEQLARTGFGRFPAFGS